MNFIKNLSTLAVVIPCLGAFFGASLPARADVTFSGADLSTLTYRGDAGDAQFVPGSPDVAQLSTPDAGPDGDAPAVYVRADNPLATSSLSNLSALNASYSLLSSSGGAGNQPYWLTYLNAPGGGYVGVVSFGGPDLTDASQIHVFYDFDSDPNPHTTNTFFGDTLATLDGQQYNATTTFGQLSVYETGPEIGNWAIDDSIGATANFDSISIESVPEPSTWVSGALTVVALGALAYRKRKAIA